MKAYRIFTVGLVLLILGIFFLGCENKEERLKKEEDLRVRVERMDLLSRRIEELDAEIEKMENTLEGLDDVLFRAKMSLANLKKAQQDISKTTNELKAQIIPVQVVKERKPFHWFWTLIVIILIAIAIYYFIKFYRSRREMEEEAPLEEGTPFESSSTYDSDEEEVVDSEDDR
jgi:uncharacterized coiled-coil protein SlyX